MPQQGIAFEDGYCDWWGADVRLCGGESEEIILAVLLPVVTLLLFSPKVLGFLFARVGGSSEGASRFAVPRRLERAYLFIWAGVSATAVVWASFGSANQHQDRLVANLLALTSPGRWAALALLVAAIPGGFVLLVSILQYVLDRIFGDKRTALIVGCSTYSLAATVAQIGTLRSPLVILNAAVGAMLIISFRKAPWLGWVASSGLLVLVLAFGAMAEAGLIPLDLAASIPK